MSRIYAVEEATDHRFLVRLECDAMGCKATIRPHPEIAQSGWRNCGVMDKGAKYELDYCPDHAHFADAYGRTI